jgi:bacteriocin-type transport-associated protein
MNSLPEAIQQALSKFGEFSDRDLNWFVVNGKVSHVAASETLIQEGHCLSLLHLLLEGTVSVSVAGVKGRQEIAQRSTGGVLGLVSLINTQPSTTTIVTLTPCSLLTLNYSQLLAKLRQDNGFAARFYRAVAMSISEWLRQVSGLLVQSTTVADQPLRKVLVVFAELTDSDIEWIITTGKPERAAKGRVLIKQGEAIDALYILLEGCLAVSITTPIKGELKSKQVATLATGEIVGEISFVDAGLPSATVDAAENSLVLAVPRSRLAEKLNQDQGFAARFYHAITLLLAERLQERLTRHGYGKLSYEQDQPLDEDAAYEDELDSIVLGNVALAGMRFDWLVRQVRSRS